MIFFLEIALCLNNVWGLSNIPRMSSLSSYFNDLVSRATFPTNNDTFLISETTIGYGNDLTLPVSSSDKEMYNTQSNIDLLSQMIKTQTRQSTNSTTKDPVNTFLKINGMSNKMKSDFQVNEQDKLIANMSKILDLLQINMYEDEDLKDDALKNVANVTTKTTSIPAIVNLNKTPLSDYKEYDSNKTRTKTQQKMNDTKLLTTSNNGLNKIILFVFNTNTKKSRNNDENFTRHHSKKGPKGQKRFRQKSKKKRKKKRNSFRTKNNNNIFTLQTTESLLEQQQLQSSPVYEYPFIQNAQEENFAPFQDQNDPYQSLRQFPSLDGLPPLQSPFNVADVVEQSLLRGGHPPISAHLPPQPPPLPLPPVVPPPLIVPNQNVYMPNNHIPQLNIAHNNDERKEDTQFRVTCGSCMTKMGG